LQLYALHDDQSHINSYVERLVDHGTSFEIEELHPHEGATLAGLNVLEFDNLQQRPVEVERHPALELVGGHAHSTINSFGVLGMTRQPPSTTSTMSSIRTPPTPSR